MRDTCPGLGPAHLPALPVCSLPSGAPVKNDLAVCKPFTNQIVASFVTKLELSHQPAKERKNGLETYVLSLAFILQLLL